MCQVYLAFVLTVSFAIFQSGETLQCWKCASEFDVTCKDHFNTSRILQNRQYYENANYGNPQIQPVRNNPHLEQCDERYTVSYNQKNVCLKRVYKGVSDMPVVYRECRLVSRNLKEGQCPDELHSDTGRTLEYCGTCEFDGCNSGESFTVNAIVATLVPLSILLFFQN